jgi:hypothetical protein
MALPGLVAAQNLADVADRERAWDNLGQSIEYPVQTGGFEYETIVYLGKVEAADGQLLEQSVKIAINNFVAGCKNDGTWVAIKACCILAGARTLSGALVPLVGTAPTNFNFVSGDYNRKTGLVGNGGTKYLNSNRNNNADPQNSKHLAVWRSTAATVDAGLLGSNGTTTGHSHLYTGFNSFISRNNAATFAAQALTSSPSTTFYGTSRDSSSNFTVRHGSNNYVATATSQSPVNANILVFETANRTDARLAFYSIGESLDLALLDARVTALINAFAAAIP